MTLPRLYKSKQLPRHAHVRRENLEGEGRLGSTAAAARERVIYVKIQRTLMKSLFRP